MFKSSNQTISGRNTCPVLSFVLQTLKKIYLAQVAQLHHKESVRILELLGKTLIYSVLLLKGVDDRADLLPQVEALDKALIKEVNLDAELMTDAAVRSAIEA